jgi:hypothetical protein
LQLLQAQLFRRQQALLGLRDQLTLKALALGKGIAETFDLGQDLCKIQAHGGSLNRWLSNNCSAL